MPLSQALKQKDYTSSQLTDSNQLILLNFYSDGSDLQWLRLVSILEKSESGVHAQKL